MMAYYIKLYFATLAAFLVIDLTWLGLVARSFYRKHLGYLMTSSPNWYAAFLFYLLFVGGILVFVVLPGLKEGSLKITLLRAALFGLVAYATYDLTNLAVVKDWPVIVTVVDLVWGTAMSAVVGWAGFMVGRWLG
jgi:uncharacterized membrane protein